MKKRRSKTVGILRLTACIAAMVLLLAACGSGTAKPGAQASGPITFLNVTDYSGPGSFAGRVLGALTTIGCDQINASGGVLGHKCKVVAVDDKSDPADGTTNLRLALASHTNIVAVTGLSTATAGAEAPLAIGAKVITFVSSGSTAFLHLKQLYGADAKYAYGVLPADELTGFAMAFGAKQLGLTHPAVVSTNNPETASILAGIDAGDNALGIKAAINLDLAPAQPSYGTEVQRLVAAHPDGIIFELDAPTSGVFFSNLVTAMGTPTFPMISDPTSLTNDWVKAVKGSLGTQTLKSHLYIVDATAQAASSPGVEPVSSVWNSFKTDVPYDCCLAFYDTVVLAGLAMLEAHSINPSVFAPYIYQIAGTTNSDGRVRVYTFAQGKRELAEGKKIAYWGATGPLSWTPNHVRVPDLELYRWASGTGGGGAETPATPPLIVSGPQMAAKLHL